MAHFDAHGPNTDTLAIADELMTALLAGDHPVLKTLRSQYDAATFTALDLSGSGFFLGFGLPVEVPAVEPPTFQLTDLSFEVSEAPEGGSVVLFIRHGRLSLLEAYLWTDDWPQPAVLKSWSYLLETPTLDSSTSFSLTPTPTRDMKAVARAVAV